MKKGLALLGLFVLSVVGSIWARADVTSSSAAANGLGACSVWSYQKADGSIDHYSMVDGSGINGPATDQKTAYDTCVSAVNASQCTSCAPGGIIAYGTQPPNLTASNSPYLNQ